MMQEVKLILFLIGSSVMAAEIGKASQKVQTLLDANPRLEFVGEYQDESYFLDRESLLFEESKSFCNGLGMTMVKLKSAEHAKFLADAVDPIDQGFSHWVGAKSKESSDEYLWVDGSSIAEDIGWHWFGNPSCVALAYGTGGKLEDNDCTVQGRHSICSI